MELPRRQNDDIFLPDGAFTDAIEELCGMTDAHDLSFGIVYAFDFRTHMLPYWYADKRMAPCSVRTLADVLWAAGFKNVRVVLQQWTPNFKPSKAVINGRPIDVLMVSAMQVHGDPSYDLVRDAHTLGERRPLVLCGGPKAIYEPTDYLELGPQPGIGADCVSTGEVYVFLDLLRCILKHRKAGESPRAGFHAARNAGALNNVPGIVYLPEKFDADRPYAVNTGVQRLLRNLDEMPIPDAGYRLLEAPHRRETLNAQPCPPRKVGKLSLISSVISTHGCKFNCSYCPIPAVNQRTWRHKSPKRLAEEIRHVYENFGIREFFSTDDNFFNSRDTVVELMTALADCRTSDGQPLRRHIRFYTEGTQFDVHKNMDILPLCRKGGMRAIWFGIEDITAELVNKGQDVGKTAEMFERLCELGIEPMAMMIHNDDQPLRSPKGDLAGVINQAKYLFDNGAVSYQCTYLGPAIGTRDIEQAASARILYKSVGGQRLPQAYNDGNHVVASRHATPWERQMNVVRGYWAFYNPLNTLRVLLRSRKHRILGKRLLFQVVGQIGLVLTAPKLFAWARKLKRGPIEVYDGLQRARLPMIDAAEGHEVFWAIEQVPSDYLPQRDDHRPVHAAATSKITKTIGHTTQIGHVELRGRVAQVAS